MHSQCSLNIEYDMNMIDVLFQIFIPLGSTPNLKIGQINFSTSIYEEKNCF